MNIHELNEERIERITRYIKMTVKGAYTEGLREGERRSANYKDGERKGEKYIKLDEALKLAEAHTQRIQLQYLNAEMDVIHPADFITALKKIPTIRILNCKECARTHFCNYSFEWGDRILEDCPLYRPREPEKEADEE